MTPLELYRSNRSEVTACSGDRGLAQHGFSQMRRDCKEACGARGESAMKTLSVAITGTLVAQRSPIRESLSSAQDGSLLHLKKPILTVPHADDGKKITKCVQVVSYDLLFIVFRYTQEKEGCGALSQRRQTDLTWVIDKNSCAL